MSELFLTANQAAKTLNISLSTLKRYIYEGYIETIRTPGGHHRIPETALYSLFQNNAAKKKAKKIINQEVYELSSILINGLESTFTVPLSTLPSGSPSRMRT